jgi:hypothetical protein
VIAASHGISAALRDHSWPSRSSPYRSVDASLPTVLSWKVAIEHTFSDYECRELASPRLEPEQCSGEGPHHLHLVVPQIFPDFAAEHPIRPS